MAAVIETGIEMLDRHLDGGLPAGSVLVYESPPASQGELLLTALAGSQQTTYLPLVRSPDRLEATLADSGVDTAAVSVATIEEPTVEAVIDQISALADDQTLIVDPIDPLERSAEFQSVLEALTRYLDGGDGFVVLHGLRHGGPPEYRQRTLHVADIVFRLEATFSGSEVENRLSIPKFRGGTAPTETFKLELTDSVSIDTSRDIA